MYDPDKHHRHTIRLRGFDYRAGGAYFLTICTRDRLCIFGNVQDGVVRLSQRGLVAKQCWHDVPRHRPYVELDEFVLMPNHVHAILWIIPPADEPVGATLVSPSPRRPQDRSASLGAIVGAYKAAVSRTINRLRPGAGPDMWQRNYYEHIIRNEESLYRIRDYIRSNPERWELDQENPAGTGADQVTGFIRSLDRTPDRTKGDTSVAPTGDVDA